MDQETEKKVNILMDTEPKEDTLFRAEKNNSSLGRMWSNPWFKFLIVPLVVAIIAGIVVLVFTPDKPADTSVSVTSYNQQGGITAQEVNIGQQPRSLTFENKNFLESLSEINPSKQITIECVLGDGEAFQFANEIKSYLESLGWNVNGVDQAVYSIPVIGQTIFPDATKIIIGSRK